MQLSAYREVPAGPTARQAEPVSGDGMPAFWGASCVGGGRSTGQRHVHTLSFSLPHHT